MTSPFMIHSISTTWRHSARLAETEDGVAIEIYRAGVGTAGVGKLIHRDTLPCSLAVARECMQLLIEQLCPPPDDKNGSKRPLTAPKRAIRRADP